MKRIILIILTLLNALLMAQYSVIDFEEGNAIPFVQVQNINSGQVVYTNLEGEFYLDTNIKNQDTLIFSCIAYDTIITTVKRLNQLKTIELTQVSKVLNEITISDKRTKLIVEKSSLCQNKPDKYSGDFLILPTSELAVYIPNRQKVDGWLKDLTFYREERDGRKTFYEINFYRIDTNGFKPGEKINVHKIISEGYKKKGKIIINLKEYHVRLPKEGCYLGLKVYVEEGGNVMRAKSSISASREKFINVSGKIWRKYNLQAGWQIQSRYQKERLGKPLLFNGKVLYKKCGTKECKENDTLFVNENFSLSFPCIKTKVLFDKSKIKNRESSVCELPKEFVFSENLTKYPTDSTVALLTSILKTLKEKEYLYTHQYLLAYRNEEDYMEANCGIASLYHKKGRFIKSKDKKELKKRCKFLLRAINENEFKMELIREGEEQLYQVRIGQCIYYFEKNNERWKMELGFSFVLAE